MKRILILIAFAISIGCNIVGAYFILEKFFGDKRSIPFVKTKVLFVGDSRIAETNWRQGLKRSDVINAGISGLTSAGLRIRIDSILTGRKPEYVVVQIGINDIRRAVPLDSVIDNYRYIVSAITKRDIKPIIVGTISIRKDFAQDKIHETVINEKVIELNHYLQSFAAHEGYSYMDLSKKITADGRLKREFTYDGIHLNEKGKVVLCQSLEPMF